MTEEEEDTPIVTDREGLTDKQAAFVDALFSEECAGKGNHRRKAATIAGYSPDYRMNRILTPLVVQAIATRAATELAVTAPKAARSMNDILDNPTAPGNRELLAAAAQILDRGGVPKIERVQHEVQLDSPVFILPPKEED